MENIIFVAHPDDELVWFSSIMKKPKTCLVICFDNVPYEEYEKNIEHSKKFCSILETYRKFIPVLWLKTPKITKPRIFGKVDDGVIVILSENIKTVLSLVKPKRIFTHNPWGEYGHSEHKAVHNILKKISKDIIFPIEVLDEANNSEEYKDNFNKIESFSEEEVDMGFKTKMIEIYSSLGLWTMKKLEGYPLSREIFARYKNE